ncbi:hypothetical protein BGZ46_007177 [Entomortierella lignicola]|nr:hypothetical protein BGZ46_007177 [Entomortierella lignicola]
MVYSTRSRGPAEELDLDAIDPLLKQVAVTKKSPSPIKNEKKQISNARKKIINNHVNTRLKDGKDHHVIEQDGRDHHHIWYRDFEETENPKGRTNTVESQLESNSDEFTPHEDIVIHDDYQDSTTPRIESNVQSTIKKPSRSERRSSISGTTIAKENLHIRFQIPDDDEVSTDMEGPRNNSHDVESLASRAERAKAYIASFFQSRKEELESSSSTNDESNDVTVSQAEATSTSNPISLIRAINLSRRRGSSPVDTPRSTKSDRTLEIHDAHQLTEKSQIDRKKAQNAIVSLDKDVVLLQRLLDEKEDALESAEARVSEYQQVTVHSKALKQEVRILQSAIHDLHKDLKLKEKSLKACKKKNAKDRKRGESQLRRLEQEILRLNTDLLAQEYVQYEEEAIQDRLDEANSQRANLDIQIHELGVTLKDREEKLKNARAAIFDLENINDTHSMEIKKITDELDFLKASMTERESELNYCKQKIQTLEGAQENIESLEQQLRSLRGQLASKEASLNSLEKINKSMKNDSVLAMDLKEEVRILKAHIKDSEWQLNNAMKSLKDLAASKEHASTLENELNDLRNQTAVQETHLAYLEESLKAHESCASESMRAANLEKELKELLRQADIKEKHLAFLEEALKEHENCASETQRAANLENELKDLREQMSLQEVHLSYLEGALKEHESRPSDLQRNHILQREVKDLQDQANVQEKHLAYLEDALQSHEKCSSEAQKLRENIELLQVQLNERQTLLDQAKETLQSKQDEIKARKSEVQEIAKELKAKDEAIQQLRQKSGNDLAKVSSTASILRTESEGLREQLKKKSFALAKAEKDVEDLGRERCKVAQLESDIKRLEKVIADKDQHTVYLDMIVENMRERVQKIEQLEAQVGEFQKQKSEAEKTAKRSSKDLAATSATASKLVVEVESLREQLIQKESEIATASMAVESLEQKSNQIKRLLGKIASLEEFQENNLEKSRQSDDRIKALETEIKEMEIRLSTLQSQFEAKEADLQAALNKANQDHEEAAENLKDSRSKVSSLTMQLQDTEKDTRDQIKAKQEQMVELLKDLERWEHHEEGWINRTLELTDELNQATDVLRYKDRLIRVLHHKANDKNQEINRLNEAVNIVRADFRDNQKRQVQELRGEQEKWEEHEEGWIVRTSEMTNDLIRSIEVIRQKEKLIRDLKHKAKDQNLEIGRLNEVVDITRSELKNDRKRRASEIEDQVKERTRELQDDKRVLKRSMSELEGHISHLQKKIRLDADEMVSKIELGEKIRELTYWKQTSLEQSKEWETTVSKLEDEKERQVALLKLHEHRIKSLESKLGDADELRIQATEEAEKMMIKITKLEKELSKAKNVLVSRDSDNSKLKVQVQFITEQIEDLEEQREELNVKAHDREILIVDLEARLREEVARYRAHLADARRELVVKDKKIDILNSRIVEYTRQNAGLESRISSDKHSLLALEETVIKLRTTLATQAVKYKALEEKHRSVLAEQINQEMQMDQLERDAARVYNEDVETQQTLLCKDYHLKEQLEEALQRINDLQLEVHNITRAHQLTLAQLKSSQTQLSNMVPAEEINHTAYALQVQTREREGAKLSARTEELTETINRMRNDHSRREKEWRRIEEGYRARVELLSKNQSVLESQLQEAIKGQEDELSRREQDQLRAEREKHS